MKICLTYLLLQSFTSNYTIHLVKSCKPLPALFETQQLFSASRGQPSLQITKNKNSSKINILKYWTSTVWPQFYQQTFSVLYHPNWKRERVGSQTLLTEHHTISKALKLNSQDLRTQHWTFGCCYSVSCKNMAWKLLTLKGWKSFASLKMVCQNLAQETKTTTFLSHQMNCLLTRENESFVYFWLAMSGNDFPTTENIFSWRCSWPASSKKRKYLFSYFCYT